MILVIDNYDSFTYNLVQILAALGAEVEVVRNDAITAEHALELSPRGIVISPGPGTPSDAGISSDLVRLAADAGTPVLGVCLGHQVIGEVFGARVVRAPQPIHGKTDEIHHDGRGLFDGLANPFIATRYHSLVVDAGSVPESLEVVARTVDGVVMALRHRHLPIDGVQFHPESVLTPEGVKLLANFLDAVGEVPRASRTSNAARGRSDDRVATVLEAIARVSAGGSLDEEEAATVMGSIMDGEATPAQISALIMGMRMKGETVEEITGFARAMRARAVPVRPAVEGCVDVCGTGGDGLHTFNISTCAAFVVAGAGVPVAKHGNRAVSSAAGSADVLEALGVRVDLDAQAMARCIEECGVGFLFAPTVHASMRHAAGPRREIAIRTVFNVLGPLTNPAGAARQLIGVFDASLASTLARVAGRLGSERVLVVHGYPGMDEVSCCGPTLVVEWDAACGDVRSYEVLPEELGLPRCRLDDLIGGDAHANARIVRRVLQGERGPQRDVVLANAAAALVAAGVAPDLIGGVALAGQAIDTGRAHAVLGRLVEVSQRLAEGVVV